MRKLPAFRTPSSRGQFTGTSVDVNICARYIRGHTVAVANTPLLRHPIHTWIKPYNRAIFLSLFSFPFQFHLSSSTSFHRFFQTGEPSITPTSCRSPRLFSATQLPSTTRLQTAASAVDFTALHNLNQWNISIFQRTRWSRYHKLWLLATFPAHTHTRSEHQKSNPSTR